MKIYQHKISKNAKDRYKTFQIGDGHMIKKIAWDTFKKTGDINTFLEYKQIEDIERGIEEIQEIQKITNLNIQNINDKINKNISL